MKIALTGNPGTITAIEVSGSEGDSLAIELGVTLPIEASEVAGLVPCGNAVWELVRDNSGKEASEPNLAVLRVRRDIEPADFTFQGLVNGKPDGEPVTVYLEQTGKHIETRVVAQDVTLKLRLHGAIHRSRLTALASLVGADVQISTREVQQALDLDATAPEGADGADPKRRRRGAGAAVMSPEAH